ncbi:MAG TPA: CHAT domain-containing tetratricopeptide repeat protein [Methylomirabilota bacterium]|jgi:CHAT domain-containing protein/Tfp pilus assembly protein PilF|nr:CHAT domain-containing tetratricopeptide repeat protein [Methylomirabilota bacterium]
MQSLRAATILLLLVLASAPGRAIADDLARARDLDAKAAAAFRDGRVTEGVAHAREALAIREKALGPDHLDVAASLDTLAVLLRRAGDYPGALPAQRRAVAIREKALGPDDPLLAATLNNLARLLREMGDYPGSRSAYDRALAIRERVLPAEHPDIAQSLNGLGALLQIMGDHAGARPLFERALRIREQALGPSHSDVGLVLTNLASLSAATGDWMGARRYEERALAIAERAYGPEHPEVATSLANLAGALRALGDFPGALARYHRALAIREKMLGPQHFEVAQTLANLAALEFAVGDYTAARPHAERALAIRERVFGRAHVEVAQSLDALAVIRRATGDHAGARPLEERALAIRETALGPAHPEVAASLNTVAGGLVMTGDLATGRRHYERALAIREQALGAAHPDVAVSLTNLGMLAWLEGDFAGARRFHERALRIREQALGPEHPDVAWSLDHLGSVLPRLGAAAAARPLYERALEIREKTLGPEHPDVAVSLGNLAGALEAADAARARALRERALAIARKTGAPELTWRLAVGLGRLNERAGDAAAALPLYREAVRTLEGLAGQFDAEEARRQYLAAGDRVDAYEALASLLLRLHQREPGAGYEAEAWAVLDARRGRVVAQALGGARVKIADPKLRAESDLVQWKRDMALALERALREEQAKAPAELEPERVRALTARLAQTKSEYLAEVTAFLARYPQYKARFVEQQTVDPKLLAKFADRLPAGTLAVQYFAAPDSLYVFVVAPGRFEVKRRAVAQAELYGLVKRYRERLERAATEHLPWTDDGSEAYRREVAPLRDLTAALAEHLLGPIAADLDAHANLVVIPNDLLLYLPIHALTRGGRFLAETHRVSYVTQLELFDLLGAATTAAGAPLLALANPDGTLPAATREVRAVSGIRAGTVALEGERATKAAFLGMAPRFGDLHLATHGVLDPARPERSYLLMAGADEAARRLGVEEIAGLSLPRGLAILSACETAVGEQVPGAALVTLAAAFSQAGAQSIVASLWKVNDVATRDFMVAFHRALGRAPRAQAIQEAQLAVLRQARSAHPFYWAPFILIGAR